MYNVIMKMRCIVPEQNRNTLMVTKEVHSVLKAIAKQKGVPISTITYFLLKFGLKSLYDMELSEEGMIERPDFNLKQHLKLDD